MKIGIILGSPPAYSETFFNSKIAYLVKKGFHVTVFVDRSKLGNNNYRVVVGQELGNGLVYDVFSFFRAGFKLLMCSKKAIRLYRINKNSGFSFRKNIGSLFVSAHIVGYKLDWIHFGFAELAIGRENLAKAMGARMAVSIRGYDMALYPLKRPNCYNLLWKRIDKLHYLSDSLLKMAVEQGFDREKIESIKIPPGIDTKFYKVWKRKKTETRKIRFLTVARLHWIKGIDDTMTALASLDNIDFEYHIVGDGPEMERLLFLRRDLGLESKVIFHGKQDRNFIISLMNNSDIYIQYSENEGFCNSLLEAQAVEMVCISSNAGGLAENIIDGETGFLIISRRPDLLKVKIEYVLSLPEHERTKIGHNARSRVQQNYALDKQYEKFINFYS